MNEFVRVNSLPTYKPLKETPNKIKNAVVSEGINSVVYKNIAHLIDSAWNLRDENVQQAFNLSQDALAKAHNLLLDEPAKKNLQAIIFKTLGYLYKNLGSYDLGLLYAFKSLELCRELKLTESHIINLQTLGWCHTHLGNFPEGLKPFLEALELCQQEQRLSLKAQTLLGLSTLYYYLENFEQALELEEETLELYDVLSDSQARLVLLNNLAKTHLKLCHLDTALKYAQESLKLSQKLQKPDSQGKTLNTLGIICQEGGDLREALHYFQGALARLQTKDSKQIEAEVFLNIGKTHYKLAELDKAIYYCQKALKSAESVDAKADIRNSHLQLAKIYKELSDFEKALFHHEGYYEVEKAIFNEKADNKLKSLQIFHETERARHQAEIYCLQNVELRNAQMELEQKMQELKDLHQKVKEISIRDGLTNLYNRRYLDEQLGILFSRARRYNQSLSIAIIDVDNFKKLNDTFSHQVGDEVLKHVANILVSDLRESDLAVRYGGEEFVLIFPETPLKRATVVCKRTCQQIANYNWNSIRSNLKVTVSIGISDDAKVRNYQEQLHLADKHLYIAKHSGKNKVIGGAEGGT